MFEVSGFPSTKVGQLQKSPSGEIQKCLPNCSDWIIWNVHLFCTLLQYTRMKRVVHRVCQFNKWHKVGSFMIQMDYNMCNNKKRWGVSPMTKIFATPPAMKYYYVTIINAYVPVHKVAQHRLTILMRNRYRIWLSDKTCVSLATVTYAVPHA